jgi:polar amino acid transport system substrate-binding protein
MGKVSIVALAVVLSGAPRALADTWDAILQRGEIVWGADAEGGGPHVFPSADDPRRMQGFEVELADLLAERMGVRARFAQGGTMGQAARPPGSR